MYDKLLKRVSRGGKKARAAVRRLNAMRNLKMSMGEWRAVASCVDVIVSKLAQEDEAGAELSSAIVGLRDAMGAHFRSTPGMAL